MFDRGISIDTIELIYFIAVCNICILLLLLDNFYKLYRKVKSDFTLGFLIFVFLLFVKNLAHAFIVLPIMIAGNIHGGSIVSYDITTALIPDVLELIALSIFLYLTRRY